MVFCDNSGGSCLNDNDNPHEDGTTFCKQIYKTKKLLAIDEKGKVLRANINNVYLYDYNTNSLNPWNVPTIDKLQF